MWLSLESPMKRFKFCCLGGLIHLPQLHNRGMNPSAPLVTIPRKPDIATLLQRWLLNLTYYLFKSNPQVINVCTVDHVIDWIIVSRLFNLQHKIFETHATWDWAICLSSWTDNGRNIGPLGCPDHPDHLFGVIDSHALDHVDASIC